MRTDADIQKDVMAQLKWEPFLNAAEIGVSVKDGVVTLSGRVDSYNKKYGAEMAARKILGVKAVAEDIHVGVSPAYRRTDDEIAAAVVGALKYHMAVQEERIKIKVEDSVVTLTGDCDWNFQRKAAEDAIRNLPGIIRVNNFIVVKTTPTYSDVNELIHKALRRQALVDADKIEIEVIGNTVYLRGTVRSVAEKDDAELAAWSAKGVTSVLNKLVVEAAEYVF
ncbi:MAG TPA: BON domain-containing protein [Puia sp.]|nr:BON domain-containing protein [Puia sp.]